MGLLTDLWNQLCEFFQIEVAEPIVPETKDPPKPYEPVESVTPLPEKPIAEAPVEEIEPLPSETIPEPTPIGEQGKADRIEVLPAKEDPTAYPYFTYSTDPVEAPFTKPPSVEDYPSTIHFFVKNGDETTGRVAGATVTAYGQTKTCDEIGECYISGRVRCNKNYPITVSKAGYKTVETKIGFTSAPHPTHGTGTMGTSPYVVNMERL